MSIFAKSVHATPHQLSPASIVALPSVRCHVPAVSPRFARRGGAEPLNGDGVRFGNSSFEGLVSSSCRHSGCIVKVLYANRNSVQRAAPAALTNVGFGKSRFAYGVGISDRNERVDLRLQGVDACQAFADQLGRCAAAVANCLTRLSNGHQLRL